MSAEPKNALTSADKALITRAAIAGVVVLAIAGIGMALPHPGALSVRAWADSVGPWFVVVFWISHTAITVLPIPRTFFTVLAGFLFGPIVGILVTLSATAASATIAFALGRWLGSTAPVARRLEWLRHHPRFIEVDDRLRRRGWLAVGSLRLIAVVPFAVVNYASAVSSVRFVPYFLATIICVTPGTCAVVLLGDALTGRSNPWLLLLSGTLLAAGIAGLVVDLRLDRRSAPLPSSTA